MPERCPHFKSIDDLSADGPPILYGGQLGIEKVIRERTGETIKSIVRLRVFNGDKNGVMSVKVVGECHPEAAHEQTALPNLISAVTEDGAQKLCLSTSYPQCPQFSGS